MVEHKGDTRHDETNNLKYQSKKKGDANIGLRSNKYVLIRTKYLEDYVTLL